ncbi:MAG: hypothetical protein P5680_11380 [Limnospira sp. PMC 737.11]|uniref:hypothetical protein n=1 Tax=unclassified Limnospira TaxID=2642885 RepID=UPI0028E0E2F7|nr:MULTISPECIES: hypothetical protein [unclassified Limnospira]MDT9234231.1 hypothetical protein [Limnospira sp. PMC 917.15]MDT9275195.1 hypothetical protein [Limnospira sp. PMC 737.11]
MKNLSLSLAAFHLCQSLDDAPDTHSPDAGFLWDDLRGFAAKLDFPELKKFTEPTDANPEHNIYFAGIKIADISLGVNLSTFKMNDTYSADLTLYFADEKADFSPENVAIFQPQALIDVRANLGKVLWLSGESEDLNQLELSSGKEWAKNLCPQAEYMREDRLFNCPLFIFAAESVTILISLAKPGAVDLKCAEDNYRNLRNLFWNYQKIVVVTGLAKDGYQGARHLYSELEGKVKEFNQVFRLETPEERLERLDALLQSIPQKLLDYNCKLRDLKAHYTTTEANLQNFQRSLSHILAEKSDDRLSYWSDFATTKAPLRLQQIKTYIDYLEPGQVLFSDLINSIRATTELEQAKSDRQRQQAEAAYYKQQQDANQDLQDHIQAVGVGIAAGAIVASTSGLITQPWRLPSRDRFWLWPHPFIIALLGSIFCSWGAWWVAERWIKKGRPKDK